ncbi:hypothetical protein COR50_18475 [Chitinophaga caeni]|uniref:Uncharacterized protein n=1 Tax=Chitinophaga caeni TaxID=2029983 RepID=A0A291QYE7_9BACT|nr:hypothetical protein COR50_18475 [Chitinophaga caeni]
MGPGFESQRDHERHSKECLFSFIYAAVAALRKIAYQRKSVYSYLFGYLFGYHAKTSTLGNRMCDGSLKHLKKHKEFQMISFLTIIKTSSYEQARYLHPVLA